ncbi:Quino protein alcohol dehydrogenase-like protein [Lophiostoma macrostomum CBS 122681]|uniref:Quino protein alcohol dehydrogenase-like protein n=1 Tax=Lophiostoma macrostomum CBS 122681 TaxID=1314788 RepID=A0A6A6TIW6_9PLEO|nr:Quino protein alcohol dehydrogenase-like protein [Lophiostoma macrostomum CBS 122681]
MLCPLLPILVSVLLGVQADAIPSRQPLARNSNSTQWTGWGGNRHNNRWAAHNHDISSSNILSPADHCNVSFPVGVSATPVILEDVVYFPTWNGSFVALNFHSCEIVWSINVTSIIESYAPISAFQATNTRAVSRTSPQIEGDVVYFGTLTHALIVAVDKKNGNTLGIVQISSIPVAVITMSPTIFDGKLFVGTSSVETSVTKLPGYQCCSFVGNMVALDFDVATGTFEVLWRVASIPDARHREGWAGASFWGSQPAIDEGRRQVFVATGNSYSSSNATVQCQRSVVPPEIPYALNNDSCLPSDVWQDSVLAIDLDSGDVNWVHQWPGLDIWTATCGLPPFLAQNTTLCPAIPGPNSDFGMAPVYVPGNYGADKLVIGRKDGNLYSISAESGNILWTTTTSPKGVDGGLSWGIAVDDTRIYFTAINSDYNTWQLQPSGQTVNRSAYGAVSLSDGSLLWETPAPLNGYAAGPPTVVGDLVLVARTGQDPNGTRSYDQTQGGLVALNKANGDLISDFMLTTNFHGGVAVDGPYILFGTGYSGPGTPALVPGVFHVLQVEI